MRKRALATFGGLLLAALVAAGWWWYSAGQAAEARALRASGVLEATEVKLASETGGRLAVLQTREGERVTRGSVIAVFDTELRDHEIQTTDPATRAHLQRLRDRQTLRSPLDGWLIRTTFEPGEQVPPGAPVGVVADLRTLTLKVYLSEDRFGRVALGQSASVAVDAYPSRAFSGQVTFIASEAEFTPRNVQTREDRVKSVFAVKLRVPNDDLRLKPGMFADAAFQGGA